MLDVTLYGPGVAVGEGDGDDVCAKAAAYEQTISDAHCTSLLSVRVRIFPRSIGRTIGSNLSRGSPNGKQCIAAREIVPGYGGSGAAAITPRVCLYDTRYRFV